MQMFNHFPSWFFRLNMVGKVKNFLPETSFEIQENLDYIFNENDIRKRKDFDEKLLTFNDEYINDSLQTYEIVKRENNNVVRYHIVTNGGIWKMLPITMYQMNNIRRRYNGPKELYEEYLMIMLLRYKFLGGLNNHLSIPPIIYKQLNVDVELFGSPLNVITREYCSPFYDIEGLFGSSGSFMDYKFRDNQIYGINPPYNVEVIRLLVEKLSKEMGELKNVTMYITIPLWRKDFPGYEMLKSSIYLKDECELKREQYPFYHYFKNRLIPIIDTYLMVLSTGNKYETCEKIKKRWMNLGRNKV